VRSKFPRDELLEERAILLSRINQHVQALAIYAHKLRNPALAEQYCARHYSEKESEEEKNMYLNLLKVYLKPPADIEPAVAPQIEPCLALLAKHYDKIDSVGALQMLGGDTPLLKLMPFLTAVLTRNRHLERNDQIVKNLLKAEYLQVQEKYLACRGERIYIDSSTLCAECKKKIGSAAFARLPNSNVVHYVCYVGREKPGGYGGADEEGDTLRKERRRKSSGADRARRHQAALETHDDDD